MAFKGLHQYQEINDFTGSSSKHAFKAAEMKESSTKNVTGLIKKTALALCTGTVLVLAADASGSPFFDSSKASAYFSEVPISQSEGPSFGDLVSEAEGCQWDEGVILVEATCTKDGSKEYKCTVCGKTKTEKIPAKGHTPETLVAVAETCTETGLTEGSKCMVCGEVLKAQEVIEAHGHNYDDGVVVSEPTCTEEGLKRFTCKECNDTKDESIEKSGHVLVAVADVAATCTEDGHTGGFTCEVCKEVIEKPTVVAATGHTFGKQKVKTKATCTKDGVAEQTCSVCKLKEKVVLPATGHTVVQVSAKAATCTENGNTEGEKCKTCGKILSGVQTIKATGHNYKQTGTNNPTCSQAGARIYTCSKCQDTYTESIPATGAHHDDDRDYRCDDCGRSMLEFSNMNSRQDGPRNYLTGKVKEITGNNFELRDGLEIMAYFDENEVYLEYDPSSIYEFFAVMGPTDHWVGTETDGEWVMYSGPASVRFVLMYGNFELDSYTWNGYVDADLLQ